MTDYPAGDVAATFDYLRDPPTDDPAIELNYYTEDRSKTTMRVVSVEMPIVDGREHVADYTLDRQGFELVPHHTAIDDFLDRSKTENDYPAEMVDLICKETGAHFAIAVGVNIRFGRRREDYAVTTDDQPARFPHADFTDDTSRVLLDMAAAGAGEYSRAAIYNVWRVFSDPPQDLPLAVCDARSVSRDDEEVARAVLDASGDEDAFSTITMVYRPNPDNRWVYFSNMTVDEALIFKQFDSDAARPQRVPHSAFANPLVGSDAPSRSSIECRVLAYYR